MRFQVVLQVKGSIAGKRQWATPGRPDPPQTAGDRLKTARERSQEQGGKAGRPRRQTACQGRWRARNGGGRAGSLFVGKLQKTDHKAC